MPRVADEAYFNHRPGHSEAWKEHAVCGPIVDHYWWARGKGARPARNVGKRICNEICPVREDCLQYAISAFINHGTWGGLDETERRALRRHTNEALAARHVTVYAAPTKRQETIMVTIIAKARFAPHIAVGEQGDVEDTVARAAVRGGYADLVGQVENYEGWMYQGEELRLSTKPRTEKSTEKATASKPRQTRAKATRKAVAKTDTDGGE